MSGVAPAGVRETRDVDLFTALMTGLASQQVSNDQGGERWSQLVAPSVDMFLGATVDRSRPAAPGR